MEDSDKVNLLKDVELKRRIADALDYFWVRMCKERGGGGIIAGMNLLALPRSVSTCF